jgi:restriction endonuclease S subunit
MVLEEVVGKIIPGLLPFFMQSDMFMDRAVAISEGSLSPKTLAIQEFPLPPIERQKEILKVLEKATKCKQLYNDSLSMCQFNQNNYLTSWLIDNYPEKEWVKLDSILERSPEYGAAETAIGFTDETFRYIRVTDINNRGELDESSRMGAPKKGNEKYLLTENDFLIARSGNTVGKTFLYKESVAPSSIFAGYLIRLKLNHKQLIPEFFKYYCRTPIFWRWLEATARGGAQPNINAKQISKMKVPLPTISEQEKALEILSGFERLTANLSGQHKKSYNLNQLYFTSAFNGGVQ